MTRLLAFGLLFLAVGLFTACGGKSDSTDSQGDQSHDDGEQSHDGDDHDGDDHDGDDHDGDDHDEHADHGERVEVGTVKIGSHSVALAVFGEIEAGNEAVLDLEVEGVAVSTLRAWIGIESGKGSMKSRIDGEDSTYHGHIETPSTLPEGSAIWIELETADGKRSRGFFPIP